MTNVPIRTMGTIQAVDSHPPTGGERRREHVVVEPSSAWKTTPNVSSLNPSLSGLPHRGRERSVIRPSSSMRIETRWEKSRVVTVATAAVGVSRDHETMPTRELNGVKTSSYAASLPRAAAHVVVLWHHRDQTEQTPVHLTAVSGIDVLDVLDVLAADLHGEPPCFGGPDEAVGAENLTGAKRALLREPDLTVHLDTHDSRVGHSPRGYPPQPA